MLPAQILPDLAHHLEPTESGQEQLGDDQVGRVGREQLHGLHAVLGLDHVDVERLETRIAFHHVDDERAITSALSQQNSVGYTHKVLATGSEWGSKADLLSPLSTLNSGRLASAHSPR